MVFETNMKKRFFILLSSLGLISVILTGCSSGSNSTTSSNVIEYGEVTNETSENNKEEIKNEANMKLPSYSESDLPNSTLRGTSENEINYKSYYYDQLETRLKIVYDQLFIAIKDFQTEVTLTKQIKPEELQLIFNMLYLDSPILIQLDSSYSYMLNNEEYIYIVGLEYCMNQDEYNELYKSLYEQRDILRKSSSDYSAEQEAIKLIIDTIYSQNKYEQGEFLEKSEEIKSVIQGKTGNSIGISRTLNYLFRTAGLEACVVTGDIVTNSFYEGEGYNLLIKNLQLKDLNTEEYESDNGNSNLNSSYIYEVLPTLDMKFSDISNDGNIYYVDNHYSTLWAWNLVKIDNNWYNVDLSYSSLLKNAYEKNFTISNLLMNAFNNVPDLTMSQTRIWHTNEQILGITPSCNSYGFQYSYRNMLYLLPHNELQMINRISETLDILCGLNQIANQEEDSISQEKNVIYQFSDENTFNYFINNFDNEVENYNKLNSNILQSYSIFYNRDSLIACIYDVVLE